METFTSLWPALIYIICIPITLAIIEYLTNDKDPIFLLMSVLWPVALCYEIISIILYPFYWIAKKLLNYFKSYQNDKKRRTE